MKIAELELKNARETSRLAIETADFDIRAGSSRSSARPPCRRSSSGRWRGWRSPRRSTASSLSLAVQDRDAVAANQAIATVVNLSQFEVEITLPENYAAEVAPGTAAQILYEGKEYPGHVTAMSPEIRDSQGHGTVAFEGAAPAGLRQSQRVSVRMVFESKPNVLKVPRGPFLESGGGRQIYVVEERRRNAARDRGRRRQRLGGRDRQGPRPRGTRSSCRT